MIGDFKRRIAVLGTSRATAELDRIAEEVGSRIASSGAILLCGGMSGVMEAAARGCRRAGGTSVGILPGESELEANPYIDIPVVTGLREARNIVLVRSCHAAIAIGGGYGTLSEIGLALRLAIPVIGLRTWRFEFPPEPHPGLHYTETPQEAVDSALRLARTLVTEQH